MSLLDSELAAARDEAEALMDDDCRIERASSTSGFDRDTGREIPAAPETVYAGMCRLQFPEGQEQRPDAGERSWTTQRLILSIPVSAPPAQVDDTVLMLASQADEQIPGVRLRIAGVIHKTHLTARRYRCEEVTG